MLATIFGMNFWISSVAVARIVFFTTLTLASSSGMSTFDTRVARASACLFWAQGTCSNCMLEKDLRSFCIAVRYSTRAASLRANYPLTCSVMSLESPWTRNLLTPNLRAEISPRRRVSYSTTLFKQGNSNLKDKEILTPSGSYRTAPTPPPWCVDDPSKARRHFFVSREQTSSQGSSSCKGSHFPEGNYGIKSGRA